MTATPNQQLVRDLFARVFTQGDPAAAAELIAPGAKFHRMTGGEAEHPVEGMQQTLEMFRAGVSDLLFSADDAVESGDKVSTRFSLTGRHTGTVLGVDGTGKEVLIPGFSMVRIKDGKIAESWMLIDIYALQKQIGAI